MQILNILFRLCQLVAAVMIVLSWFASDSTQRFWKKHRVLAVVLVIMTVIGIFGTVIPYAWR